MPTSKLILLTGATGFIGFQTLLEALTAGFRVRCTVRSAKKAEILLSKPALQSFIQKPQQPPAIEIAIVPNQANSGAFSDAIRGASYVIHGASPQLFTQSNGHSHLNANDILDSVRGATLELLTAAAKSSTVERVVITSSVAVWIAPKVFARLDRIDPNNPITPTSDSPTIPPPFQHPGIAYAASKIAAFDVTRRWVNEAKPPFGVVNIHPSWVLGRAEWAGDDMDTLLKTTNRLILDPALRGMGPPYGPCTMGAVVDVCDIARIQVQSLQQEDIVNNGHCRSFIASIPARFEDIPDIVRRGFAEEVENGRLAVLGEQASFSLPLDASDTERTFGLTFRSFKEMAIEVIAQYLELRRQ